ncbi:MAG: hypothetical protein KAJ47_02835, partial [Candidatus Aenigmarchaeota archaeon]|nr:hypothetical protein [Candidatus Aenigmarchaeota archaeon]
GYNSIDVHYAKSRYFEQFKEYKNKVPQLSTKKIENIFSLLNKIKSAPNEINVKPKILKKIFDINSEDSRQKIPEHRNVFEYMKGSIENLSESSKITMGLKNSVDNFWEELSKNTEQLIPTINCRKDFPRNKNSSFNSVLQKNDRRLYSSNYPQFCVPKDIIKIHIADLYRAIDTLDYRFRALPRIITTQTTADSENYNSAEGLSKADIAIYEKEIPTINRYLRSLVKLENLNSIFEEFDLFNDKIVNICNLLNQNTSKYKKELLYLDKIFKDQHNEYS